MPLLAITIGGWIVWRATWADAAAELGRTADAEKEYATAMLTGYRVAAGRINDLTGGLSDQQVRDREAEIGAALDALLAELPLASGAYVIDRNGVPLAGAGLGPGPRDRPAPIDHGALASLSQASPSELLVDPVQRPPPGDKALFTIGFRRTGAGNGLSSSAFDGLVVFSLEGAKVSSEMRLLAAETDDFLALLRKDGEVLARAGTPDTQSGPTPASLLDASTAGAANDRAVASVDGTGRLVSVRRTDGFPIYVVAARTRAAIVAEWRRRIAPHLIFAIPATLALLALSLLVRRVQLRLAGVATDVTDRKQVQLAVQQSELRLRDLLRTLDLASVLVRDMAGRITFWSEGCTQIFGWAAAEATGQVAADLLHTVFPLPRAEIDAALAGTGEWTGDTRQTRRDGSEIIVAVRKVLKRDDAGQPVAVMESFADVTALRRTQSELERINHTLESRVREEVAKRDAAQARAAHAERIQALGQLAGGIAHDLINVLQAITSGAALVARDVGNPERVLSLSQLMIEAAQRGAAVTGRLLSFSRRADLQAEPIDPRGLLIDISELLADTLGGHVGCKIDAPEGLPRLFADRGQLETALVNLAINARDAMPNGGDIVASAAAETVADTAAHPAGVAPGRYLRLSITDKGIGMDAATLARVTEPFFTTKQEGTGLGLAMVRGFVEQSGGAIAIESSPGDGTTVSLWLPEAQPERRPQAARRALLPAPGGSIRILLVDDDAMARVPLEQALAAAGYDVRSAGNGPRALELLASDGKEPSPPVDVIVCDLSMPGMNGIEVIRAAQARWPLLPAILVTGYVSGAAALPSQGARYALLRKPLRIEQLAGIIAILLAGRGDPPLGAPAEAREPSRLETAEDSAPD